MTVWEIHLLITPTFQGHVHGLLTATLKQPVKTIVLYPNHSRIVYFNPKAKRGITQTSWFFSDR